MYSPQIGYASSSYIMTSLVPLLPLLFTVRNICDCHKQRVPAFADPSTPVEKLWCILLSTIQLICSLSLKTGDMDKTWAPDTLLLNFNCVGTGCSSGVDVKQPPVQKLNCVTH